MTEKQEHPDPPLKLEQIVTLRHCQTHSGFDICEKVPYYSFLVREFLLTEVENTKFKMTLEEIRE